MKIEIFSLLSDNGDGGYTVRLFPSKKALDDYMKAEAGDDDPENDPYQYGYKSYENPITLEIEDDGNNEYGRLVKQVNFGFGQ